MAEGGRFPWKVQKIDSSRGPVAEYRSIRQPLPKLPNGSVWHHDEKTGEWKVQKKNSDESTASSGDHVLPSQREPPVRSDGTPSPETKEPALAVDYVEHTIMPSDTFQGLCIRYRITATQLRQANGFSGTNLLLAPPKLVIPLSNKDVSKIRLQDQNSPDYKIHSFLSQVPKLRRSEARAYLELSDWNVKTAVAKAQHDIEWEKQMTRAKEKMSGIQRNEIQVIHVGVPVEKNKTETVGGTKKTDELEMVSLPKPR